MATLLLRLTQGAAQLGVALDEVQAGKLLKLAEELIRWNKTYNLTAVDAPAQVLTHHLLDSLCVNADLAGTRIADVGTGGGFPGLPLAILNPGKQFTLIDSAGKKLRFIGHVARLLGLSNVQTLHTRVEQMQGKPYDTVVTRAFAPMPRLLEWVRPICDAHTRIVAMKGRWPPPPGSDDEGALPAGFRIQAVRRVQIPDLAAERHVVTLSLGAAAAP
jgi:16S rRNA (guanine527-N7)-methyltransferase